MIKSLLRRPATTGVDGYHFDHRAWRWVALVCSTVVGCGHAPPRSTPEVRAAEQQRRDRLPEDQRTLDATWDEVHVQVAYVDGRTQATLELRHPKLRFFYQPPAPGDKPAPVKAKKTAPDPSRSVPDALRELAPFDIDRIEIHDGEFVFADMSKPLKPEIWLSDLEVSIENVASRPGLAEGRPVLITARAKVQRSGEMALFVSADPWSRDLNFSGRVSLEGLATKELFSFLADTANVQVPLGSLDLYAAFTATDGHITGGVKPILKNAKVKAVHSGAMARLKAWAIDTIRSFYSDRVEGRNAVVTVIPIRGELAGPEVKLWPAMAGVLYNAFVNGVSAGFGGVPAEPKDTSKNTKSSGAEDSLPLVEPRVSRVERSAPAIQTPNASFARLKDEQ